jgi:DNA polymerase III subunit epsilon
MGKAIPLSEATFVVVDIETTGSIPGKHAVTEIAAVKVRHGQVLDRFESLVNPHQEIPEFIQQLTGITPEMVKDAPDIDAVMPAFWDFLGEGVFVAHHVPFDFRFLNAITKSMLGSELDNPQLCTCRLARKLLPGLRRKNLDSVSQHFNITIENRHRAMGDAQATALILVEFLKIMESDGIDTLAKMLQYQKQGGKRYGDMKIPFPEHRVSTFPQRPGVYLMRDEKGEILYIGKAKNLRKRLQSYFTNLYRQPHKVQELMHQVLDIETRVLGSELEALLEESYLIKQHQPYYNRQIKNYKTFPFLKITAHEPHPQLEVTFDIENDSALYFGPYQRKRHLSSLVDALTRVFQLRGCTDQLYKRHQKQGTPCISYEIGSCTAPCARKVSQKEYHDQVRQVVDFLEGRVSDLTQRMITLRDGYAETLAFEKAQRIQDRLLELLKLQANTQYLSQAVHQNHLLILLPDREPPRNLIIYVYKGRPIYKQVFDPRSDEVESILERVQLLQKMLQANMEDKHEVIHQTELEEIRIIAQWLRHYQPDAQTRIWSLTQPYAELAAQIYLYFGEQQTPLALFQQQLQAEF